MWCGSCFVFCRFELGMGLVVSEGCSRCGDISQKVSWDAGNFCYSLSGEGSLDVSSSFYGALTGIGLLRGLANWLTGDRAILSAQFGGLSRFYCRVCLWLL